MGPISGIQSITNNYFCWKKILFRFKKKTTRTYLFLKVEIGTNLLGRGFLTSSIFLFMDIFLHSANIMQGSNVKTLAYSLVFCMKISAFEGQLANIISYNLKSRNYVILLSFSFLKNVDLFLYFYTIGIFDK